MEPLRNPAILLHKTVYRCLTCGSIDAEQKDEALESWFWRKLRFNFIGPFCSDACSRAFPVGRDADEPQFTLAEWERLRFLKHRLGLLEEAARDDDRNLAAY